MTITDLCAAVDVRQLFVDLGGKWKGNRAKAFWRNGDGLNIILLKKRGYPLYDTVQDEYISTIGLVQLNLHCDKKAAVRWLESYSGATLNQDGPSAAQILAARTWREAKLRSLQLFCDSIDTLKMRIGELDSDRKTAAWVRLCRLQKDAREEAAKLKVLRIPELIAAREGR